jgi:hypothetical protein
MNITYCEDCWFDSIPYFARKSPSISTAIAPTMNKCVYALSVYQALSCSSSQLLPEQFTPYSVSDFLRRIVTLTSNFLLTVSNGSSFIVRVFLCSVSLYTEMRPNTREVQMTLIKYLNQPTKA